jgi:uncharacterized protein (DUF302 family)
MGDPMDHAQPLENSAARLGPVAYGVPGEAANRFQRSRICPFSVLEVAARLRETIEAADLWVLHEIDPQALAKRGGYGIGAARQILFFHPRFLARLLTADPGALLEAPLKFAMLELPEGTTLLRWTDPAASLGRYGNSALASLGLELAAVCEEIVTSSLRSPAHRVQTADAGTDPSDIRRPSSAAQ